MLKQNIKASTATRLIHRTCINVHQHLKLSNHRYLIDVHSGMYINVNLCLYYLSTNFSNYITVASF